MKVIIDHQDDLISIKEGSLAETILSKLEPLLYSSGKLISKIKFNGEIIDLEVIESSHNNTQFSEEDTLEVETQPLKDHLIRVIDDIESCLDKVEEDAIEISENILKSQNSSALEQLSNWGSELSDLISNIQTFMATFKVNIEGVMVNNKPLSEGLNGIAGFLNQINKALENNEKTTIADLIEFEVSPIVGGIKELLPTFKNRLNEVFSENSN